GPTRLYFAERLTRELGGPKIYLKREDLLHTGAHKINNAIGQVLLARRMGKTRIIAETGAGQHGVATATVAAMFGLKCVIYMGEVDCARQALNVYRMKMLGAEVVPVHAGQKTLKEAVNEAMRDWVTNVRSTHYILGTAYGAHPYPVMVRNFQRIIGDEARRQILEKEERLPDQLIACVGGRSRTRLAARPKSRPVHLRHGRPGPRRLFKTGAPRRHHSRAGIEPRRCGSDRTRAKNERRPTHDRELERPWRQRCCAGRAEN